MNPMVRRLSPQARVFSEILEHFHSEFSLLSSGQHIFDGSDKGIDFTFPVVCVRILLAYG